MAHNIGEMFYYGEAPWHKLGKKLKKPATWEEALKEGGLDWEVSPEPLTLKNDNKAVISRRVALVRNDRAVGSDGRVVGVVHPGYAPLQNRQAVQIFDSLLGKGEAVYHTGGYLKSGEVIWLLAKIPGDILIGERDVVEPYLLLTNSHDGSIPIDIRLTTVRVVCNNTLTMALDGFSSRMFRRGHYGNYEQMKVEAKAFFEFTLKQCEKTQALFKRLAGEACDQAAFKTFISKLLPDPAQPASAATNKSVSKAHASKLETLKASRDEIFDVHLKGIPDRDIPPAEENWWGALNSVTAWVDHLQKINGDRYAHAMFGSGDKIKALALKQIALRSGRVCG
jgi:phage/plasmid-like protein (TIGR03299 family)